ncbi:MAG TPA: hypothetical protein VFC93_18975 [Chloroflexota bacterium]|nr:hypothetical protein [Chloroflexota bacterium]
MRHRLVTLAAAGVALAAAACATPPSQPRPAPPAVEAPRDAVWSEAPPNWQAATPPPGPGTPAAGRAIPPPRPSPPPAAARGQAAPAAATATPTAPAGSRPIQDVMATLAPPTATRPPRPVPTYGPPLALPPLPVDLTPEATATPVPRVAYAAPPLRNGDNKWGVGVYRESNRIADLLRETQPGVILLMDPTPGFAHRVRQQHPNAFVVGRRFKPVDQQPLDNPDAQGALFADWVAELAVPMQGDVDAWMSYNEVLGSPPSAAYDAYNRFQVAFARRLQYGYGIPAVAANDGPGVVEPADYPRYFGDAIRISEYFGVHAYAPPGDASLKKDPQQFMLRYRRIHDALEAAGIHGKKMVITESGVGDGFRLGVASGEQMAAGFAWFTSELRKDPYMIGQAAFGLFDSTGPWAAYDLTDTGVIDVTPRLLGLRR